ncbi:MAG: hypothetical protein GX817_06835 [Elusimicrobia bacterium]|nr:hypothetical protein [Elusimicrobiota bacterium]
MFKKFTAKVVIIVQSILIYPLLFFLYIIGFGITMLFTRIFVPSLYRRKKISSDTFWDEPEKTKGLLEEL